jgi:hypothetical protein
LAIYFSWSDFGWFVGFWFGYESGCAWNYFWKSIKCSLGIVLLVVVCLVVVGWLVLKNAGDGQRLVYKRFGLGWCNFIFWTHTRDFFGNFLFYKTSLMYYLFGNVKDLLRSLWLARYHAPKLRFLAILADFVCFW